MTNKANELWTFLVIYPIWTYINKRDCDFGQKYDRDYTTQNKKLD